MFHSGRVYRLLDGGQPLTLAKIFFGILQRSALGTLTRSCRARRPWCSLAAWKSKLSCLHYDQ
jgi:hypothetical protein